MASRIRAIALIVVAGCGSEATIAGDANFVSDDTLFDGKVRDALGDGDAAVTDGAIQPSDQVWFVGDTMPVLHFDGMQVAATTSMPNTYNDAWGTSPTNIYALAWDGGVIHYDGNAWATSRTSTSQSKIYTDLFGTSASDVWALGESGTILRFEGNNTWTATTNGTISNWASCLWGTSLDDMWAIGYSPKNHHWDGSQWNDEPYLAGMYMFAAWGSSATDIWAVGQTLNQGSTPNTSTIAHYDGATWSRTAVPANLNQPGQVLNAVWGASASDIWAVGKDGLVAHWNGTAWTRTDVGTTRSLNAVGGSSSDSVWVAGRQGTILHRDAAGTWLPIASGTTKSIYGLWVAAGTVGP